MGYFNIFYKITRIIDMLTRKRNRKFILALCLVGAVVFFSPNMTFAQYTNLDSQNLLNIRTKINEIDSTLDTYIADMYGELLKSNVSLSNISLYTSTMSSNIGNINTNIINMKANLQNIKNNSDELVNDVNDLLDYIDRIEIKINNINDIIVNIESILNSIGEDINTYGELNHQDQEEIKSLIKEYLYGDKQNYPVSYNSTTGLQFDAGHHNIIKQGNGVVDVIQMKKGYRYVLTFDSVADFSYRVLYFYRNSYIKPIEGYNIDSEGNVVDSFVIEANGNFELVINPTSDIYFYVSYLKVYITLSSVTSNYNEGQEEGIYGGLTIINNQTKEQGEQTRDTITSTDYNSEDVSINTDSISNIDSGQTEGLFTTIFNNFNSAITGGINEIIIPLPNGAGNITLRSDIVSSHIGKLSALISAFWYFVFGFYAFKFVNNLLHNIKDGSILDGFKNNNEVITQDML